MSIYEKIAISWRSAQTFPDSADRMRGELDALLAIVAHALHEVVPEVLWLLSGHLLRYHRHVQPFFVGDAGSCEVDVDIVLLIFRFGCNVPL